MCFNLQYGNLLHVTFAIFEEEKKSGKHKVKWDEWLREHIGISPSYSRKLRQIASLLKPYFQGFSTVGLSFFEIYSMRKELKAMFLSSEEIRNYWATPKQQPMCLDPQSSQDQPSVSTSAPAMVGQRS